MHWLSIFLEMQTGHRLPSNKLIWNYDLHEQAFYVHSTAATFFYNGNLQICDEFKEECLNKVLTSRTALVLLGIDWTSFWNLSLMWFFHDGGGERCLTRWSKVSYRCSSSECHIPIIFLLSAFPSMEASAFLCLYFAIV